MATTVAEEFVIPACDGRAFTVRKGQVLRIIAAEGPQAADMVAFNLHDHRETYCAWLTRQMSRSFTRSSRLFSRLPAGNIMFRVVRSTPGTLWLSSGRCNKLFYRHAYGLRSYHKNCQDILAETLKPFRMTQWDIPDVFNIFMRAIFRRDGTFRFTESQVRKNDSVSLLAKMDCLVAISACPDEFGEYNGHRSKSVKVQVSSRTRRSN
jgi:uncharacterized protein YcgI (DUF1989 family)